MSYTPTSPVRAEALLSIGVRGWILSVFFLSLAILATAQSDEEGVRLASTLSGPSQRVIERLSSLDALPADGWKTHAGDLAHGEALDLDDSSWPIVHAKAEAETDAVWYRRSITVPLTLNGYDLTGDGEAKEQIPPH